MAFQMWQNCQKFLGGSNTWAQCSKVQRSCCSSVQKYKGQYKVQAALVSLAIAVSYVSYTLSHEAIHVHTLLCVRKRCWMTFAFVLLNTTKAATWSSLFWTLLWDATWPLYFWTQLWDTWPLSHMQPDLCTFCLNPHFLTILSCLECHIRNMSGPRRVNSNITAKVLLVL